MVVGRGATGAVSSAVMIGGAMVVVVVDEGIVPSPSGSGSSSKAIMNLRGTAGSSGIAAVSLAADSSAEEEELSEGGATRRSLRFLLCPSGTGVVAVVAVACRPDASEPP